MERNPIISWYVLEDDNYMREDEYYLGSYSPDSEIKVNVQVWNNRYGQQNSEDISNARLVVYFDSAEDNAILKYCSIAISNASYIPINTTFNKGVAEIGMLLGTSNNGIDNVDNNENFKNISLLFKDMPSNLKNGIKNMYLDIELE